MSTATPKAAQAALQEKLLRLEEFSGCSFAATPRLYSYKQSKHMDFSALLLNSLNAPVLIITSAGKNHRVLLQDYPSLKYLIALDAGQTSVLTRGEAFPLETLLGEKAPVHARGYREEDAPTASKRVPAPRKHNKGALLELVAALAGAFLIILLLVLFLLRI